LSASKLVAAPVTITIEGRAVDLLPMTLYEFGRAQVAFESFRRRQVRSDLEDATPEQRQEADKQLRDEFFALSDDITPVIEWLCTTLEGRITGVKLCLDAKYPGQFSHRQIATWMRDRSVPEGELDPLHQWMINSGVVTDPTNPASPPDQNPPDLTPG